MHWDFVVILLLLAVAVPLLGRRRIRQLTRAKETRKSDRLALYASTIVFQWLAALVILWRVKIHGIDPFLLGIALPRVFLAICVTIVLSGLILVNQIYGLRRISSHPEEAKGVMPQLAIKVFPQDTIERVCFAVLVVTVAICEEFIFRGFAQYLFQRWLGGWYIAGIFGSAVLFSWAHLYQGRRGLLSTLIAGFIFSAVRTWTGSLLPSVVSHFVADLVVGFVAPPRFRAALAHLAKDQKTDAVPALSVNPTVGSYTYYTGSKTCFL